MPATQVAPLLSLFECELRRSGAVRADHRRWCFINKIVIVVPTVDLVCECITGFHMVMKIFQVVQCLCVQLIKTNFVFPSVLCPGLSVYPLARWLVVLSLHPQISRPIRPNVFLQFVCFVMFCSMRATKWEDNGLNKRERQNKTQSENEQNEWAKLKRKQSAKQKKKYINNQKANRGTCPEQSTQRWFKTPFNCRCCCLGHHIVFWDGCGAGCGVAVFAVQLGCQSHSFVMLCLGPRDVKNSESLSMGDKVCTRIFQLFWNYLAQNHAYIYIF